MATPQPFFTGEVQPPSPARITEIDISASARALAVLRWSDYALVVMCGLGALGVLPELITSAVNARWAEVIGKAIVAAVMAFAAFTGWRHVGVIDPRVWRWYLWVFPLLAATGVLGAFSIVSEWITRRVNPLDDLQSLLGLLGLLWFAGVAIPGFVCVLWLRRMRIAPTGIRLDQLLTGLIERGGVSAPSVTRVERVSLRRAVVYGTLGAAVLLATVFAPLPADSKYASPAMRLTQQLNLLAFFLIVRARRYFQVSADSLLAVDKRPPILFLRSFADDERQKYGNSQNALLDFSLETRLANHFYHFGPFIAVGSPKDTVPQPGAARVLLADDEWQSRVLGWMESSSLIVMYCGTTEWVTWELRKIVESGRSTSLILMIPEIRNWRASRRQQDIAARVRQIRDVFSRTPWNEELMEFSDFPGLRAMLFRADGSMVMVRSRSRSRDSYHLAALIAHQQLLDPTPAAEQRAPQVGRRKRRLVLRLTGALAAAAAVLAAVYVVGANQESRLTLKQGELLYAKPVTPVEARGVGEYLVKSQYFSDDKAVSVRLDRKEGRYRLQFVFNATYADAVLVLVQLGVMGSEISRDVLGGKPIDVLLSDNQWKPIKAVPASAKLTFGMGELYYTDPVTAEVARRVGEKLRELEYFGNDRGASAHLGREQQTYQLRFVVDRSRVDRPDILKAFRLLTADLSLLELGGETVMMHLCDDEFRTWKSERIDSR
jgi:hypothetical protein